MATVIIGGPKWGPGTRDRDGQRTWKLTYQVRGELIDGPAVAIQTPGLPQVGDFYVVPGTNEVDEWATCKLDCTVTPREKTGNTWFDCEFTFSTKGDEKRCKDQQIDDPLLRPPEISGNFTRFQEAAAYDRFGNRIENSSHEPITGPHVEFDKNRMSVNIKMWVANLQLPLLAAMNDTLNDSPLWGIPRRCIKLTVKPWKRLFYGLCYVYYEWDLDFEIRIPGSANDDAFDRKIQDEGSKVLYGHWDIISAPAPGLPVAGRWVLDNIGGQPPDPANPMHYRHMIDFSGTPIKGLLDGHGEPAGAVINLPSNLYLCIENNTTADSPGEATGSWALIPSTTVVVWSNSVFYATGSLVTTGVIFLCTEANKGKEPVESPDFWLPLLDSRGNPATIGTPSVWDPDDFYDVGNVVEFVGTGISAPGEITIQKYDESNFLLLGIPTSFVLAFVWLLLWLNNWWA